MSSLALQTCRHGLRNDLFGVWYKVLVDQRGNGVERMLGFLLKLVLCVLAGSVST